ncbi:transglutaminase family protein [Alkanindiges sp. WGS2144]|uniref:transglutaminase-like domain-containing protein n=1 Tax=Alkanindiges sp. WGS2144 TaxID=3366808 RepID=UPI003750E9FD
MYTFDIDCSFGYQVKQPSEFIFHLQVAHHPWQQIHQESLNISPHLTIDEYEDEKRLNRLFRLSAPIGKFELRYQAQVNVDIPYRDPAFKEMEIAELPPEVLHYLLPSRYCESDLIGGMAQRTFGKIPRGFDRIEAICDWIHSNIAYEVGSSQASTTARDVLANRAGVCRDFAHLGVALCRALNIPARFVFGYAEFEEPPPDFHALFEAYIGNQWVLFDATRMAPIDKIVRIGTGADAKDVAFATIYGDVEMIYMKPFICDHVEGQPPRFIHQDNFIGRQVV